MEYQVINRPKLARNKYGEVENKGGVGSGNSLFSPTSSSYTEGGGSSERIRDFIGSTATEDGIHGLVPAPKSNVNEIQDTLNDNVKFLKGSGTWVDIPISRYTTENQNKDGVDLNGNLTVTDTITTQTLNVLGSAHFWELIIDKVKATGGNVLISPANMVVDFIGADVEYEVNENLSPFTEMFYNASEGTGIYGLKTLFSTADIFKLHGKRVYMKNSDGSNTTVNEFEIGDMVRCKTLNLGENNSFSNKDYWTFVLQTGTEDYLNNPCKYIDIFTSFETSNGDIYPLGTRITSSGISPSSTYTNTTFQEGTMITEFKFGYGTIDIEEGDNLIVLGHLWNGERQGAIILSAVDPMDADLKAPAIAQYRGIRTFGLLNIYRTTIISAYKNEFQGSFKVNYNGNYVDLNERINIFSNDITSGLEKVGIHLDGDNSTIKMVGSVEVRQNGVDDIETLTVWDEDGKMRVKITPEAIPTNVGEENIVQSFNAISQNYNIYNILSRHTWTQFIWSWNHKWEYYTNNAYLNIEQNLNLGSLNANEKISISDFSSNILTKAYFKNTNYTNNRGIQSISSIIIRLQRDNNGYWENVESENLTSGSTISITAENAAITYNGSIFNNYILSTSGTYRLHLEVVFNIYATITFDSEQTGAYYSFNTSVNSKVYVAKPTESLTIIGKDGIVFNTENTGEYFKASENGIVAKWGDASITLDSSNGLKITSKVQTVSSSSNQIDSSTSIVNATGITSATTIYLPDASTYGVGRELTIYGNDYVSVAVRYSGKILEEKETESSYSSYPSESAYPFTEYSTYSLSLTDSKEEDSGDGGTQTKYYRYHKPVLRLLNLGLNWLKIK